MFNYEEEIHLYIYIAASSTYKANNYPTYFTPFRIFVPCRLSIKIVDNLETYLKKKIK